MNRIVSLVLAVAIMVFAFSSAQAIAILEVDHSPFIGPEFQNPIPTPTPPTDCPSSQCAGRPFDTTNDLAFQGGLALPAVTSSTIPDFETIHQPEFINDGNYGNGAAWVANSLNSWLKIDLSQEIEINRVTFGRDRIDASRDGRSPGQYIIEVALFDDVYANGNDNNDILEYSPVLNSADLGFSGLITGGATLQSDFDLVLARFVKISFAGINNPVGIDEVEIFNTASIPEPSAIALIAISLAGLVFIKFRFRDHQVAAT